MICHLQTNKVKEAVRIFDMIQSVDSVKIAEQIDRHAAAANKTMEILVQVNSSYEEQKFGFDPADAISAIESIKDYTHIRVAGLMTIGALIDDSQMIERCFMQTRDLFDQIKQKFSGHPRVSMTYLSMGMSHDYQIAIRCGANMVRIGSALFS